MTNHLLRAHAPISDSNWTLLDDEARERLSVALAARKLVDFSGPHGWEYSATNLGRVDPVAAAPCDGISAVARRVLPVVELRAEFAISRAELRDDDRGAADADLEPLDAAAHRMAVAENRAVFHGWPEAAIVGIAEASPHQGLQLGHEPAGYPRPVASAVEQLLRAGIAGPYALALGTEQYKRVVETAENGGYPLLDHLRKILEGDIVWTPGLDGAVVLSTRGEDFLFESGQDLSLGYLDHDRDHVHLYLEQSFSFHVATPEAAAPIRP
ncbi:MAG: family 1 encapsulin nanocompartment shell protein [Solirubrobacteraceae bacterium]